MSKPLLEAYAGRGVIFALLVPPEAVGAILPWVQDVEDTLHLTLCYLGTLDTIAPDVLVRMRVILEDVLRSWNQPIVAAAQGVSRFFDCNLGDPEGRTDAVVISVSSPAIAELQRRLVERLEQEGLYPPPKHSFTPHITLGYYTPAEDGPVRRFAPFPVEFKDAAMMVAGTVFQAPLEPVPANLERPVLPMDILMPAVMLTMLQVMPQPRRGGIDPIDPPPRVPPYF